MIYPVDYDSFMKEAEESGIKADDNVKHFLKEYIGSLNDAYYQGRLDESLRGGGADE